MKINNIFSYLFVWIFFFLSNFIFTAHGIINGVYVFGWKLKWGEKEKVLNINQIIHFEGQSVKSHDELLHSTEGKQIKIENYLYILYLVTLTHTTDTHTVRIFFFSWHLSSSSFSFGPVSPFLSTRSFFFLTLYYIICMSGQKLFIPLWILIFLSFFFLDCVIPYYCSRLFSFFCLFHLHFGQRYTWYSFVW